MAALGGWTARRRSEGCRRAQDLACETAQRYTESCGSGCAREALWSRCRTQDSSRRSLRTLRVRTPSLNRRAAGDVSEIATTRPAAPLSPAAECLSEFG